MRTIHSKKKKCKGVPSRVPSSLKSTTSRVCISRGGINRLRYNESRTQTLTIILFSKISGFPTQTAKPTSSLWHLTQTHHWPHPLLWRWSCAWLHWKGAKLWLLCHPREKEDVPSRLRHTSFVCVKCDVSICFKPNPPASANTMPRLFK